MVIVYVFFTYAIIHIYFAYIYIYHSLYIVVLVVARVAILRSSLQMTSSRSQQPCLARVAGRSDRWGAYGQSFLHKFSTY